MIIGRRATHAIALMLEGDCTLQTYSCEDPYTESLFIGTSSDYEGDYKELFTNGQTSHCPDGIARSANVRI